MQYNQAIFESLFNRSFAEGGHTGFLEDISNRHPYFSPAQFFLLQQLQGDTPAFNKQAVKTNILFNNPLWLNFQLKQTSTKAEPVVVVPETGTVAATVEEETEVLAMQEETAEPVEALTENTHTPEPAFEPAEEIINSTAEPLTEIIPVQEETTVTEPAETIDNIQPEATDSGTPTLDRYPQEIAPPQEPETETETAALSGTDPGTETDNGSAVDTGSPEQYEKEIEPMKISLKMPEEKTTLSEAMLFEPMHMVDYFASQGIKLSEDMLTGDKLGKQLKSFTEWLKTMKKVHTGTEGDKAVNSDSSIQVLAENSNTEAEIVTEAMAEVFAQQGKKGKATEVYKKLSLLNPAKSTYFAAKIDNLKGL